MSDIEYDEVAKIYYMPHDGRRLDYYCPKCHLEHYPWLDYEFRPWDVVAAFLENGKQTDPYEYRELIADKELDRRLKNGLCLMCGKDAPYMTVAPRDCKQLGDYRFAERPAPPPEELLT